MAVKIKICGMRDPGNVEGLLALKPDYLGFIFYLGSKRYVDRREADWIKDITGVKKTGVFVNASLDEMLTTAATLSLTSIQLHGSESPEICRDLKLANLQIIKAFGINDQFNWKVLESYQESVDHFLFDTAAVQYGGTGTPFDWEFLRQYTLDKPYFLSGGIGPENLIAARSLHDERLYALDLNSRFEERPGIKNIPLLKEALASIIQQ